MQAVSALRHSLRTMLIAPHPFYTPQPYGFFTLLCPISTLTDSQDTSKILVTLSMWLDRTHLLFQMYWIETSDTEVAKLSLFIFFKVPLLFVNRLLVGGPAYPIHAEHSKCGFGFGVSN